VPLIGQKGESKDMLNEGLLHNEGFTINEGDLLLVKDGRYRVVEVFVGETSPGRRAYKVRYRRGDPNSEGWWIVADSIVEKLAHT